MFSNSWFESLSDPDNDIWSYNQLLETIPSNPADHWLYKTGYDLVVVLQILLRDESLKMIFDQAYNVSIQHQQLKMSSSRN